MYQIRLADENDVKEIMELLRELDSEHLISEDQLKKKLVRLQESSFSKVYVVILSDEKPVIVGTFTLYILENIGHGGASLAILENVVVRPEYRKQGIGRYMILKAIEIAKENGCYKLMLSSNEKRTEAHKFYENLGFAIHGISFKIDILS
ncbi:GNAT family N-acetyltransferase [Caldicellulosiruptor morganii]|uniref:GNAT family N-acetyltransferase n=1 Tax=Caldicellulosiruptor morganii TaxID=1387555 RepID=A0ABY7BNL6_9FIRM|nr:GNAT family N-acetyltransferase [Caldicellulosiruptor morganii]WAM33482.1 GNAT family N-acetyltransferase [Caldicellulosiruptor morganii]